MRRRLLTFLLAVIICNTLLFGQNRKISITATGQPLTNVLEQIRKKSGYNIVYSDDVVSDTMSVTFAARNEEVSNILNSILEPNNLFYSLRANDMIVIGSNALRKQGITMAYSQSKLTGHIIDIDGNAVSFATISLYKNNIPLTDMACNKDGFFEFTFPLKKDSVYMVAVSSVGFISKKIRFTYPDTSALSKIILEKDKKTLGAVTVATNKPIIERKVDRLVYNVENSIGALGGDALDALRITPTLQLKEDEIKIIGKSSVKVMVNDKIIPLSGEALTNYLRSIPTATIQQIEVISTPPAKYDAEGNSGLVNIKLKQAKNDSWNASVRSSYTQATYPSFNNGLNFSYKKNKIALLADLSYNSGKDIYTNNIFYHYPSELWHNQVKNKNGWNTITPLLNLQYKLTPKGTFGIQYSGWITESNSKELNHSESSSNNQLVKDYSTNGNTRANPFGISINTNYSQKIDTSGKNFTIDLDFFKTKNPRDNDFTSSLIDLQNNNSVFQFVQNSSIQDIKNYSAKTDFYLPYRWGNVEFGAKASRTVSKNNVQTDFYEKPDKTQLQLSQTDKFKYSENLQALYFSFYKILNKKWEAKAGLRGEYTQTQANSITTDSIVDRNYFKIFPTAYLLYKANGENTFSANFSRRISRPGFYYLNPARIYFNPNSYTIGNPFLQPSFTYNYSINYNYKKFLNVEAYYSRSSNGYGQIAYHDTINDYQIFKRLNFYNRSSWGITTNFAKNIFPWWEMNSTVFFAWSRTENSIPIVQKYYNGRQGGFYSSNTFSLNSSKTFLSTFYFMYSLPQKENFYEVSPSSTLNIGFKYLLMNKRMTVGLNFNDIFKQNYSTINALSEGIQQSFTQYYDSREVKFSVSYNFGNKNISVSSRKGGNQEEKNRSN